MDNFLIRALSRKGDAAVTLTKAERILLLRFENLS